MRQALQQLSASLFFAVISMVIIFGALFTTLAEQRINTPPTARPTETSSPTSAPQINTDAPATLGLIPSSTSIPASPTHTATLPPSTACPAPTGWGYYVIQLGDTLESLATRYGTSATTLKEKNCLITNELLPDTGLHVPPYATATPIPCGPPRGWVQAYRVQAGDNLYRIGLKYRVSVAELQQANCKGYSTQIKVGESLYVPNVPTSTAVASNTPSPTNTLKPTNTATLTPVPPTNTPSLTSTFTPTPEGSAEEDSTSESEE